MIGALISQLGRLFPQPPSLGQRGERAAARHLRRAGYRVLARNYRTKLGEVDLIAEDRRSRAIVIVEVKTTSSEVPPPEVHVDHRKRYKLASLAALLSHRFGWGDRLVRFDVVAIVWPTDQRRPSRITHHVNAFEAPGGF